MNRQEEEESSTTDKNCTTKQEQEQVSDMSAIPVAMDKVAAAALRSVLQRVSQAAEKAGRGSQQIRVVAVSKTKPVSLIKQVYDVGHRCFGENYAQEFIEKAPQLPEDIEWHFIGNLQSNKVKPLLASVPNLDMVESVDDEKIANHLDRAVGNLGRKPLKVLVQVNTSGEEYNMILTSVCLFRLEVEWHLGSDAAFCSTFEWLSGSDAASHATASELCIYYYLGVSFKTACSRLPPPESGSAKKLLPAEQSPCRSSHAKSGVEPSGCVELAKHVIQSCTNLQFCGLMTIGMLDYTSTPENFKVALANCRNEVCKALGIPEEQCELSMGMSNDFEQAIEMGSSNVRIGSTIFGPREYPKKK
ncbi:hypothetical protein NC653_010174 [Populus alba x Populus x berolinensis]|uniref:Pyridoxal phosphate homeostasis protein n=1 Tax=Populus alba x Populus x berolinensis TaxID=444605 RepID=A0AAD6QZ72_9ROSI|nr:hypothetical protein NC653_010174 [Populus alba x Populus x berolinensis]